MAAPPFSIISSLSFVKGFSQEEIKDFFRRFVIHVDGKLYGSGMRYPSNKHDTRFIIDFETVAAVVRAMNALNGVFCSTFGCRMSLAYSKDTRLKLISMGLLRDEPVVSVVLPEKRPAGSVSKEEASRLRASLMGKKNGKNTVPSVSKSGYLDASGRLTHSKLTRNTPAQRISEKLNILATARAPLPLRPVPKPKVFHAPQIENTSTESDSFKKIRVCGKTDMSDTERSSNHCNKVKPEISTSLNSLLESSKHQKFCNLPLKSGQEEPGLSEEVRLMGSGVNPEMHGNETDSSQSDESGSSTTNDDSDSESGSESVTIVAAPPVNSVSTMSLEDLLSLADNSNRPAGNVPTTHFSPKPPDEGGALTSKTSVVASTKPLVNPPNEKQLNAIEKRQTNLLTLKEKAGFNKNLPHRPIAPVPEAIPDPTLKETFPRSNSRTSLRVDSIDQLGETCATVNKANDTPPAVPVHIHISPLLVTLDKELERRREAEAQRQAEENAAAELDVPPPSNEESLNSESAQEEPEKAKDVETKNSITAAQPAQKRKIALTRKQEKRRKLLRPNENTKDEPHSVKDLLMGSYLSTSGNEPSRASISAVVDPQSGAQLAVPRFFSVVGESVIQAFLQRVEKSLAASSGSFYLEPNPKPLDWPRTSIEPSSGAVMDIQILYRRSVDFAVQALTDNTNAAGSTFFKMPTVTPEFPFAAELKRRSGNNVERRLFAF